MAAAAAAFATTLMNMGEDDQKGWCGALQQYQQPGFLCDLVVYCCENSRGVVVDRLQCILRKDDLEPLIPAVIGRLAVIGEKMKVAASSRPTDAQMSWMEVSADIVWSLYSALVHREGGSLPELPGKLFVATHANTDVLYGGVTMRPFFLHRLYHLFDYRAVQDNIREYLSADKGPTDEHIDYICARAAEGYGKVVEYEVVCAGKKCGDDVVARLLDKGWHPSVAFVAAHSAKWSAELSYRMLRLHQIDHVKLYHQNSKRQQCRRRNEAAAAAKDLFHKKRVP
jgi:hypothetical protein